MTGPHSNDSIPLAGGLDAVRDPHGEPLSAMMDGTLSDDESRFLLRRMQHDAELAGRWERWQLYGDAMRGSAGCALPADFGRRIALAIAAGDDTAADHDHLALDAVAGDPRVGAAVAPSAAAAARRPLLRWGGGAALAASVAFVAIVGLRPGASVVPHAASSAPGTALVDAASTRTAGDSLSPGASPAIPAQDTSSAVAATTVDTAPGSEASAVIASDAFGRSSAPASSSAALASAPLRTAEPSSRAVQAEAAGRRPVDAPPHALAAQPVESVAALRMPDLRVDFGGETAGDEAPLIAKPWPRSPLLQGRMDGGVMVDYGQAGDGRGLILARPAQPPQSASPLLSPPLFTRPADASAAGAEPSDSSGTGRDPEPGVSDGAPR